jgi:hypothetical protein
MGNTVSTNAGNPLAKSLASGTTSRGSGTARFTDEHRQAFAHHRNRRLRRRDRGNS